MKYYLAAAAALFSFCATAAPPQDTPAGEQRFRALYKELVETNTSLSAGNCTLAAERMAARLKAAGIEVKEGNPLPGQKRFFARDPFGNRLEFLQQVE